MSNYFSHLVQRTFGSSQNVVRPVRPHRFTQVGVSPEDEEMERVIGRSTDKERVGQSILNDQSVQTSNANNTSQQDLLNSLVTNGNTIDSNGELETQNIVNTEKAHLLLPLEDTDSHRAKTGFNNYNQKNVSISSGRVQASKHNQDTQTVKVTIGRIEIKAVQQTQEPKPQEKKRKDTSTLSLSDYVKQRKRGER